MPPNLRTKYRRGFEDGERLTGKSLHNVEEHSRPTDDVGHIDLPPETTSLVSCRFQAPPPPPVPPPWFLPVITAIAAYECTKPSQHLFQFTPSIAAAQHNSSIISKHGGLAQAIAAQPNSCVSFGSEFRPVEVLAPLFKNHPLWGRMSSHLEDGASYPLEPIDEDDRILDVQEAIKRGNHKSTEKRREVFVKQVSDEISRGFYLPVSLDFIKTLPNVEVAPHGIVEQNSIDEFGQFVLKDRVTHDQSFKWSASDSSVNSRVKMDQVTQVVFGNMLRRVIHYIVGCRQRHPTTRILGSKTDFSKAYKRCTIHPDTAIKCVTQFPMEDSHEALIALRLTFGGRPCPSLWCDISEPICDLTNDILRCQEWDPSILHSPIQAKIPPPKFLADDIPFAEALPTIVEIPEEDDGKADLYIDDQATWVPDIGNNLNRGAAAAALSAHIAARPVHPSEKVERDDFLALKKLLAEAGLSETMILLGWLFDTRRLKVSLPENKFIAWSNDIQKMLTNETTTAADAESLIGRLNHAAHVVPLSRHFISRIRTMQARASNRRSVNIRREELADLRLWHKKLLPAARDGVSMNLLTFRVPTHLYRSDACEYCLGGYSAVGRAWRWVIPTNMINRAHISLLEFLGSIIGPWIDIIEGNFPEGSVSLAMGDNTNAAGWMRKSNFQPKDETDSYNTVKLIAARKHASIHIDAKSTNYSQWFPGKQNIVSDCLSRDFHLSPDDLTRLLFTAVPEQVHPNFKVSPLPEEISSWLRLCLGKLQEISRPPPRPKTSELAHGVDGLNFSSESNTRAIQTWRSSNDGNVCLSSQPLHNACGKHFSALNFTRPWLVKQSEVPWITWHRPSGLIAGTTPVMTTADRPASSFYSSTEDTR